MSELTGVGEFYRSNQAFEPVIGPANNPFRPAPGSDPPALVGRDEEAGAARYSLNLSAAGASAQPIIFTGLRGMGKTALLRRYLAGAEAASAVVVYGEASDAEPLSQTLQRGLDRARRSNASLPQKLKSGLDKVLKTLPRPSYELPNDMGAVALRARQEDSVALVDALEDLNDTTRNHGRHLVFAIDEIQDAPIDGLRGCRAFRSLNRGNRTPRVLPRCGTSEQPRSPSRGTHVHGTVALFSPGPAHVRRNNGRNCDPGARTGRHH